MAMRNCLQLNWILLLLMIVCVTQATIVPNKFRKLNSGENIAGKVGAELTVRSKLQCSDRFVYYL